MTKDEHEGGLAVLRRLSDAFDRYDAEAVVALPTPDIVSDATSDAVRTACAAVWRDMPHVACTVKRHTLAGDRAATEWLFSGTRADGSRVEVEGGDLSGFRGRRVARKAAFRDGRVAPRAA